MKRKRKGSRLNRIERKCDEIIQELAVLRRLYHPRDIDALIERMHLAAREMRRQCRRERDVLTRMCRPSSGEL